MYGMVWYVWVCMGMYGLYVKYVEEVSYKCESCIFGKGMVELDRNGVAKSGERFLRISALAN